MKKLLSTLLIICFSLAAFSQNKGYEIKLKVNGMKDSTCYLINYYGKQRYYKDTAQFNNKGVAIFKGEEQHHGGIYTLYTGGKILFEFVINGESVIDLETDTTDYINSMKVNKSEENKVFFENIKFIGKKQKESQPFRATMNNKDALEKDKDIARKKLNTIGKEIYAFRMDIIKNHPELFVSAFFKNMKEPEVPQFEDIKNDSLLRLLKYEYVKTHYWDNVDFSDARINYTPIYHNKLEKYFKSVIYPMPDSIIKEVDFVIEKSKANDDLFRYTVHYLLGYYERSKIMGMDGIFSHIGLNYYTHDLAFWVDSAQVEKVQDRARKIAPLILGKKAINLSLLDTSGNKWINLHRDVKADYTVLIFWDPDCGHCKTELPKLVHYVDSIKDIVDIKVYSVSSDHSEEWKKFIRDNNLDFINVAVPREVYKDQQKATELIMKGLTDLKSLNYSTTYDIFSTPQVYLLDKSKKIIGKKTRYRLIKIGNHKRRS